MDQQERDALIAPLPRRLHGDCRSAGQDHAGGARRAARARGSGRCARSSTIWPTARRRPASGCGGCSPKIGPEIKGYDQDEFARRLHYDRPHETSLELFKVVRESTAELLERMSPADWLREGTHSEVGRYTPETWLTIYAAHAHKHAHADPRGPGRRPPTLKLRRAGSGLR